LPLFTHLLKLRVPRNSQTLYYQ